MQKIKPFLWFDDQAGDAARFYTSIFKNSKMGVVSRYGENSPGPAGKVMVATFEIEGQEFMALNGGPIYQMSPATSFLITCEDQAEVDWYWDKLVEGGEPSQCGWLTDKFGVTWQVCPKILGELLSSADAERSGRAMAAMLQMVKLDIAKLQAAYDGLPA